MKPQEELQIVEEIKKSLLLEAKGALMKHATTIISSNSNISKWLYSGTHTEKADAFNNLIFNLQRELVQLVDDVHDYETMVEYRLKKAIEEESNEK